ncbi:uncharacterized protein [Procambarus clarkii]|uniref:uncharacterized protein isoform X2 n=1 Tax=Procambarus clarkii TaxID=6728 RepID=UPI003742DA5B
MCMCVWVLWLMAGVGVAQEAFYDNYAYTKVMAECLGDRVYQEYLHKVSTARRECGGFPSVPTTHGRGTPTPHGRGTPTPHGRGTPTPHGRGTPTPHGRGTPTSLLTPLSFVSTYKDQRQGGILSQQQGVPFQQPGIYSQQPGIRSQQPGIRSQQPGLHSQQHGIYSQQPGVNSQQHGIHPQDPGVFSQQPVDFSSQAGLFTQQPVTFTKRQEFSFRQPEVFSQQPGSFSQQPGSFSQQPGSFSQQPGSFSQQHKLFSDTRGLENVGALLEVQESSPFYPSSQGHHHFTHAPSYRQKRALVVGERDIHRAMLKVEALFGNFTCVLHRLGMLCLPVEQQGSLVPQKLKRLITFVKCEKEARLSACLKHDLRKSVSQVDLGLLPTSGGTTDYLERLLALLVMAESANQLELI